MASSVASHQHDVDASHSKTVGDASSGLSASSRSFWKWVCAATTLVSGVMCSVAVKMMFIPTVPIYEGGPQQAFDQPFWPSFIMFCGEALCLFVYAYDELIHKKRKGNPTGIFEFPRAGDLHKRLTPFYWWTIPAVLDLIGTTSINAATTMTYASTVGMLRNAMLIFCSLFTIGLMGRPLRVHEWIGIVVMTAGMVAAGIMSVVNPDPNANNDRTWLGILLAILGTAVSSLQLIFEEKILERTYSPAMRSVAIEGLTGVVGTVAAIGICHGAGFYNFKEGWYQMNHDKEIMGANFWYLAVVFIFNGAGLLTTALGSGLLRGVIFSCRAPIVWIIELCAEWNTFSGGGLASVILSAAGFLIFSYIIPFVSRSRTPKFHAMMRKGISCFCTKPLPESDEEELEGKQDTVSPGTPETAVAESEEVTQV